MSKHYTPPRIVFFILQTRLANFIRRIANGWLALIIAVSLLTLACSVSGQFPTEAPAAMVANIPANILQTATGTPTSDAPTAYAVSADNLNLRACGGTSCKLLTVLTRGAKLTPTGYVVTSWDKSEWWQVQTAEQTGWVNARWIEVAR